MSRRAEHFGCKVSGCDRGHWGRGYCRAHLRHVTAGGEPRPIAAKVSQYGLFCPVPECGKPTVTKGFCAQHGRARHLYKLTEAQVIALWTNPRCAICGTTEPGKRSYHIDHDHEHCKTGCKDCIRGLLCGSCNIGLGNFKDDVRILQAALDYLTAAAA